MSNNLRFVKWARDAKLSNNCLKKHRIYGYEPSMVFYRFGNYPTRETYYPTQGDWEQLDLYAENGVVLINVREPWSDLSGFFGKTPNEPVNERAFRRLVAECHRRGLKVVPYMSPGYMDIRSPIHRPEWSRNVGHSVEVYEELDILCPGSPGHRANFFCTVERLMDSYGLDGLYFDGGFRFKPAGCFNPNHDNHVHFSSAAPPTDQKETVTHADDAVEGAIDEGYAALWNEFLCELYARIKRRNGVLVLHAGSDRQAPFADKCWDYQLIGEGIGDVLVSIERTKHFEPYVYRMLDWSRLITNWQERDLTPKMELVPGVLNTSMAACIPYLEFPCLAGGCFLDETDEDIARLPGVKWKEEWDHWTEWRKALRKLNDPFTTTGVIRDPYFRYLRLFRKMTTDNTIAHIEVTKLDRDAFPVTDGRRRVSVFVNDSIWVAIGNLDEESAGRRIRIAPLEGTKEAASKAISLQPNTLTVLRYYDLNSCPEVFQLPDTIT